MATKEQLGSRRDILEALKHMNAGEFAHVACIAEYELLQFVRPEITEEDWEPKFTFGKQAKNRVNGIVERLLKRRTFNPADKRKNNVSTAGIIYSPWKTDECNSRDSVAF